MHVMKIYKYTKYILVVMEETDKSIATVGVWETSIHPCHILIGELWEKNSNDMKEIETIQEICKHDCNNQRTYFLF